MPVGEPSDRCSSLGSCRLRLKRCRAVPGYAGIRQRRGVQEGMIHSVPPGQRGDQARPASCRNVSTLCRCLLFADPAFEVSSCMLDVQSSCLQDLRVIMMHLPRSLDDQAADVPTNRAQGPTPHQAQVCRHRNLPGHTIDRCNDSSRTCWMRPASSNSCKATSGPTIGPALT